MDIANFDIPQEAVAALSVIKQSLAEDVIAVYLFGSTVMGGLRVNSDVDLLIVTKQRLNDYIRRKLTDGLMLVSGKIRNNDNIRPLEVTIVCYSDIVPWQYPPRNEFLYGEWLREQFEQGEVPAAGINPDLAIVLAQIRKSSVALIGVDAATLLAPIPSKDLKRAMKESLPDLLASMQGDERNVLLTLARMWYTLSIGEIVPKDVAAEWARDQLPSEQGMLLDIASKAYRGEYEDHWEERAAEVLALVSEINHAIVALLVVDDVS